MDGTDTVMSCLTMNYIFLFSSVIIFYEISTFYALQMGEKNTHRAAEKKPRDETAHQTQLRGKNAEKLPNVQELRHTHCFNDIFKRSLWLDTIERM